MSIVITIPNTFATQTGNVAASELDANFTAVAAGFALCLSTDGTQGPTAPLSWVEPLSINVPGSASPALSIAGGSGNTITTNAGVALTVTGVSGTNALAVISSSSATTTAADFFISRAGSTANMAGQGPGILLNDSTNNTGTIIQQSGNQTEIYQYNAGVAARLGYWNANRTLTLPAAAAGAQTLNVTASSTGTAINMTPGASGSGLVVGNCGTNGVPWISLGSNYITTGSQTATFTATNKPGSGTTAPSAWMPVLANGVIYYSPLWQ